MHTSLAYPFTDPGVDRWMVQIIREAGGRIPRHELEQKFLKRFNCPAHFITGDENIQSRREHGTVFKLEDGIVSAS